METDLSLIEMSGADYSLLSTPLVPLKDDVSSSYDNSYFSCSPLLPIPRFTRSSPLPSPTESSSTRCEDSTEISNLNKENTNLNKPEPPKLSIEPQQMKRKKKGGGYNLRKSLAWDRAFFTEQGVLDPLELSILSGNLGKSNGETLSVIHEGRESLSGELDSVSDSSNLQVLEDNLFKELPSTTRKESRKIKTAGSSSPKLGSSTKDKHGPASAAKRKVLSAHDINRNASKRSGCPRPMASSSLKRPPNTNTMKVATKDSRVSKLMDPKPHPSVVSLTSGSSITTSSHSRSNFNSKPVNAQKNVGLKGMLTNTNPARNDAKAGVAGKLITKSTVQQARKKVVKVIPGSETHSASRVQLPMVRKANNSSEVVPAAAYPVTANDSNTSKIAVTFTQNALSNGGNMQHTKPQTTKPSGLRMPSPSLGFFGQSKPSGSHNPLHKSNIPNFSNSGTLNPIHQRPAQPSGNVPECPSEAYSVKPTVDAASCGKIKTKLGLNNNEEMALQEKHNYESTSTTDHLQQMTNLYEDVDPQKEPSQIERISRMDHIAPVSKNNKLPLQHGQLVKYSDSKIIDFSIRSVESTGACLNYPQSMSLEDEGPWTQNIPVNQLADMQNNSSMKYENVHSELQCTDVSNTKKVHEDQVSGMHEATDETCKLRKPDSREVEFSSSGESQGRNSNFLEDRRASENLNNYNSSNAHGSQKVQECDSTSYCPSSSCLGVQPTKDGITGIDHVRKGSHGDRRMLQLDGNLLVECSGNLMSALEVDDLNVMTVDDSNSKSAQQSEFPNCWSGDSRSVPLVDDSNLMTIDDSSTKYAEQQAELPNSCPLTEETIQEHDSKLFNSFILKEKSYREFQDKEVPQSSNTVESMRTDTSRGDLGSSKAPCSRLPADQDSCLNEAGNAKTASADSELEVENTLTAICEDDALASMDRSQTTDSDCCPIKEELSRSKVLNPQVISEVSNVMQVDVAAGMNDTSDHSGVTEKKFDASAASIVLSNLQTGNEAYENERGTSVWHEDYSSGMHEVKEQSTEEAMLINPHSQEVELVIKSREAFSESKSCESESEIPNGLHLCEIMDNELVGVDNVIKETKKEEADGQLHGNLVTDCLDSNISASWADKSSSVVDDISGQPKEHLELQNHDLVTEEVAIENCGLCPDDNWLLMNASIGYQEEGILENVSGANVEQGSGFPCESSPMQNVGYHGAKNVEHQSLGERLVENIECCMDSKSGNGYEHQNQARLLNSCSKVNGDQMPLDANTLDSKSKPVCVFDKRANETSNASIHQDIEVNLLEGNVYPEESEVNSHQSNGGSNSKLQDVPDDAVSSEVTKDATVLHKESVNDNQQDALVGRPPPNAVPFSDEWLAAFEAAGEEILAKKGGAVQNSPPEKSLPEPSPWSPVRKKNNQLIGPYDCTKFTNANNVPSSTSP